MAAEITIARESSVNPLNAVSGNSRNNIPSSINSMSEEYRQQAIEAYQRVRGLSDEQKARITPLGDPMGYTVLARTSTEKENLISLLDEKGTRKEYEDANPFNSGKSGTWKVGGTTVRVMGTSVQVGTSRDVSGRRVYDSRANGDWSRMQSTRDRTDFKSKSQFSVFDKSAVDALKEKIRKKK